METFSSRYLPISSNLPKIGVVLMQKFKRLKDTLKMNELINIFQYA